MEEEGMKVTIVFRDGKADISVLSPLARPKDWGTVPMMLSKIPEKKILRSTAPVPENALSTIDKKGRIVELDLCYGCLRCYCLENHECKLLEEIVQMVEIESIKVASTHVTRIPREILQLSNLTTLKVSGSRLTELPSDLWCLENLTSIDFFNNRITHIPRNYDKFRKLEKINLSFNYLEEFPWQFAWCELNEVKVSHNSFCKLFSPKISSSVLDSKYRILSREYAEKVQAISLLPQPIAEEILFQFQLTLPKQKRKRKQDNTAKRIRSQ